MLNIFLLPQGQLQRRSNTARHPGPEPDCRESRCSSAEKVPKSILNQDLRLRNLVPFGGVRRETTMKGMNNDEMFHEDRGLLQLLFRFPSD
jgi:hypothetical protein